MTQLLLFTVTCFYKCSIHIIGVVFKTQNTTTDVAIELDVFSIAIDGFVIHQFVLSKKRNHVFSVISL